MQVIFILGNNLLRPIVFQCIQSTRFWKTADQSSANPSERQVQIPPSYLHESLQYNFISHKITFSLQTL